MANKATTTQNTPEGFVFSDKFLKTFFEYQTPKVVTVYSVPLGLLRLLVQVICITFVFAHNIWYMRGYQEFSECESSVTIKIKGLST